MEEHSFVADEVVIKEGEEADSMYIIQEGQAVVSQALDEVSAVDGGSCAYHAPRGSRAVWLGVEGWCLSVEGRCLSGGVVLEWRGGA